MDERKSVCGYSLFDTLLPPLDLGSGYIDDHVDVNIVPLQFHSTALSAHQLEQYVLAIVFIAQSATSDPDNDPFGGVGPDVVSVAQNVYVALLGITIVCGESVFTRCTNGSNEDEGRSDHLFHTKRWETNRRAPSGGI